MRNEKDPIVFNFYFEGFSKLRGPKIARIAPISHPFFMAPRIPHFYVLLDERLRDLSEQNDARWRLQLLVLDRLREKEQKETQTKLSGTNEKEGRCQKVEVTIDDIIEANSIFAETTDH